MGNSLSNKYARYSKITEDQFEVLIHCFVTNTKAKKAASDSGLTVLSVKTIYLKLRKILITDFLKCESRHVHWYFDSEDKIICSCTNDEILGAVHFMSLGETLVLTSEPSLSSVQNVKVAEFHEIVISVLSTNGINKTNRWLHLNAATWIFNRKGTAYQDLKRLLIEQPL